MAAAVKGQGLAVAVDTHGREPVGIHVRRFPVAVVRREGRVLVFANLWLGADGAEVSADLMYYLPEAPNGVMDYLFVDLLLWARAEGADCFNLGMAPFSGLEDRALAPLWNRAGSFLFRHGEHLYNVQGLREFRDKFVPVLGPRCLASPGGLALPRILANVATLISRGGRGVEGK